MTFQIREGDNNLGLIQPHISIQVGDILNINGTSYKVQSRQFFFTGNYPRLPLDETMPSIFVERI